MLRAHRTMTFAKGRQIYQPDAGYRGSDAVDCTVSDDALIGGAGDVRFDFGVLDALGVDVNDDFVNHVDRSAIAATYAALVKTSQSPDAVVALLNGRKIRLKSVAFALLGATDFVCVRRGDAPARPAALPNQGRFPLSAPSTGAVGAPG